MLRPFASRSDVRPARVFPVVEVKMRSLIVLSAALILLASCAASSPRESAERLVLSGPRFWTGDVQHPWADALVVEEGRIVAVLDRRAIGRELAGGGVVRQLPGAFAAPALADAHAHILGYGKSLDRVDLVGATSLEEVLERVRAFAAAHPGKGWILGRGWDQNDWPRHGWPDADRLEQVVPDRPCALSRIDGHALWVNRTALAIADIDGRTPDPPGGAIHRDPSGRPTGILIDNAEQLIESVIPPLSSEQRDAALEAAARALVAAGLATVHDMGVDRATWQAMVRLASAGRFPLRVFAYASAGGPLHRSLLESGPRSEGRLHLVGVKFYADGALGSRGARLSEPYSDQGDSRGLWVTDPATLRKSIGEALRAGLQPAVHAIGDEANRVVIDIFIEALADLPAPPSLPPRLEHAQILDPADIRRAARAGIVVSMQPTHATSDMPWVEQRLGAGRLAGAYAWKSFLDAGARLVFGSDFPVESIDPRRGLYAAVTRQDRRGRPPGGWLAEQRVDLATAFAAMTSAPAAAVGRQADLGRLVEGTACDLTVFAHDPFEQPPRKLLDNPVVATVIDGHVFLPPREGEREP